MADDAASLAEGVHITFNVKAASDQKHVFTLPSTTTIADLKVKLASPEYADIPAERQRLIYSGRLLKDPDTLADVQIKDGNSIHLVKSAASNARQNPAHQATASTTGSGSAPVPQVPTNITAGTGNNLLAGLTGARFAGFHGLPGMDTFGPDGGMGPPPDANSMLELMDNPMFLSQMNEAMNNPAVVDMMLQNPMVRNNPMLLEMLRNPEMRRMMFSPDMMRMQLQMQRSMDRGGSSFPAPGVTDNTPQAGSTAPSANSTTASDTTTSAIPENPFAALSGGAGSNPFASLFAPGQNTFAPPPSSDQNNDTSATAQNTQHASSVSPDPFANIFGGGQDGRANPIAEAARNLMQNPEAMRSMMQMMGGGSGASTSSFPPLHQLSTLSATAPGANSNAAAAVSPFAALFGPGGIATGDSIGSSTPADNRPPEEIYETQLRQLNEMGFYEFERNISALRRSGGSVQGAIEHLLNGGS